MPLCYLVLSAVEGINEFSQNCQICISYAVWIKVHHAFLIRQALGHRSFDSTLAYVNPSDADASAALSKAFNQGL
jgi:hypothetical protein